jgi:hypothetical protein
MTSMLTEMRGDTIPSDVELERLVGELSEKTEQVEYLAGSLKALTREEDERQRPWIAQEQAWELHFCSENYRIEGERLLQFADEIQKHVETLYREQLER